MNDSTDHTALSAAGGRADIVATIGHYFQLWGDNPQRAGERAEAMVAYYDKWARQAHAHEPYLTPHGVADTLLESLVSEVEAETAADLREELRRALRTIENLRQQHHERTTRERHRARQAQTLWQDCYVTPGDHEVGVWCGPCTTAVLGPDGWNLSFGSDLNLVDVRVLAAAAQAHRDRFHPTPMERP